MAAWVSVDDISALTNAFGHHRAKRFYLWVNLLSGKTYLGAGVANQNNISTTDGSETGGTGTSKISLQDRGISAGDLFHIAVTAGGGTAKVYFNGVLDSSFSYTQDSATDPDQNLFIGKVNSTGSEAWAGEIKDVRIHNRALEADEVKGLYNGESTPFIYADAIQTAHLEGARGRFEDPESENDSDKATKWIKSASGNWDVTEGASGGYATFTSGGNDKLYTEVFSAADVGKRFALTFTVSANALIQVNVVGGGHDYVGDGYTTYATGTHTVHLTAISGQTTIAFWAASSSGTFNLSAVSLVRAGEVAAYTPKSINDKWYDETSNANHGTITGATTVDDNDYRGILTVKGRSEVGNSDSNADGCIVLGGAANKGLIDYDEGNGQGLLRISSYRNADGAKLQLATYTTPRVQVEGDGSVKATSAASDNLFQVGRGVTASITVGTTNAANGSTKTIWNIYHQLGTYNVVVSVREANASIGSRTHVETNVHVGEYYSTSTSTWTAHINYVAIEFASAPADNTMFNVTVIGI